MRKVLFFLLPFLIAILIFFGILFFLDRKTGKGALQATSTPKSRVFLGKQLIGDTPLCACDLAQMLDVGDYVIRLVPHDLSLTPFEEKITINKGTLTVVDRMFADGGSSDANIISLSPLDNREIEILVVSLPDKANVFLDNNPVGVTPLLLKQISESDHDLRITRSGYKEKSIKIKTALGFKLNSLVFLGVDTDLSNNPVASSTAGASPAIIVAKVLILNTPTGFLRVRESNSASSSEVAQVKPGESYELIEEKDNWFKIGISSSSGEDKLGWISAQYAVKQNSP